jgi:hypothetical protein
VFKPAALPFPAQNMDDIGRLSQSELEGHLTQVSCWSPLTVTWQIIAHHKISLHYIPDNSITLHKTT